MLAEDHTPPKRAGNEPFANWVEQKEKKKKKREEKKQSQGGTSASERDL